MTPLRIEQPRFVTTRLLARITSRTRVYICLADTRTVRPLIRPTNYYEMPWRAVTSMGICECTSYDEATVRSAATRRRDTKGRKERPMGKRQDTSTRRRRWA